MFRFSFTLSILLWTPATLASRPIWYRRARGKSTIKIDGHTSSYRKRIKGKQTVVENPGNDLAMPGVWLCEETFYFCAEGWKRYWLRHDLIHSGLSALLFVLR